MRKRRREDGAPREEAGVEEAEQYTQLASAAAGEGRIDEAGELIRHAMEVEPTLIDVGFAINEVAARDRPAADRLMLDYKDGDGPSAQFLTYDAVQRLKATAEKESGNDTYVPTLLAPGASSIRAFKQSSALRAMSELALSAESAGGETALDVLDSIAETANKARITSEQGSANFNAESFAKLAAKDSARVRAAASRFEDRLQRIVALANAYRGESDALLSREKARAKR